MHKAEAWLLLAETIPEMGMEDHQYLCHRTSSLLWEQVSKTGVAFDVPDKIRESMHTELVQAIKDSNGDRSCKNPYDWYYDVDCFISDTPAVNEARILLCLFFALENDETALDFDGTTCAADVLFEMDYAEMLERVTKEEGTSVEEMLRHNRAMRDELEKYGKEKE